jgi:hypothetical protein
VTADTREAREHFLLYIFSNSNKKCKIKSEKKEGTKSVLARFALLLIQRQAEDESFRAQRSGNEIFSALLFALLCA